MAHMTLGGKIFTISPQVHLIFTMLVLMGEISDSSFKLWKVHGWGNKMREVRERSETTRGLGLGCIKPKLGGAEKN